MKKILILISFFLLLFGKVASAQITTSYFRGDSCITFTDIETECSLRCKLTDSPSHNKSIAIDTAVVDCEHVLVSGHTTDGGIQRFFFIAIPQTINCAKIQQIEEIFLPRKKED